MMAKMIRILDLYSQFKNILCKDLIYVISEYCQHISKWDIFDILNNTSQQYAFQFVINMSDKMKKNL